MIAEAQRWLLWVRHHQPANPIPGIAAAKKSNFLAENTLKNTSKSACQPPTPRKPNKAKQIPVAHLPPAEDYH
jgi:hypothetical protein